MAAACVACLALTAAHADSTRFGADLEFAHDTNVNRATGPDPEKSDNIVSVEGYAARSRLLSFRSGLILRGGLRVTGHAEYRDLGHVSALGRAAWRYQHNPGYSGTWLELAAGAEARRHNDSRLRDGYLGSLSASVGKHVTDRVRLGAGAGYEARRADGTVYDTAATRIWGNFDYRLTPRATLYASVTFIDGDQVFNAAYDGTRAALAAYAKAIEPDPALAKAFGGVTPVAYRMSAETMVYELGMNVPLRGNQAIDVSASMFDAKADGGGQSYDGAMLRLMYMHRFR
jgi:hypothetical protein